MPPPRPCGAQTLDKVSFGTNWVAQAEHGGFFQAVADGTYKKYGLDVTIVPGGPNVNNRILLIAGEDRLLHVGEHAAVLRRGRQQRASVAVAAMFQKDPQVLLAHPEVKVAKLEDLKPLTLFVSKEGIASYFQWLKSEYGFDEKKVRPYTFNPQPFLANKQSAMQGYVTSEPYAVEKAAGFKPNVDPARRLRLQHLFDPDRDAAANSSTTSRTWCSASSMPPSSAGTIISTATTRPPMPMIKKLNPEMTDELIAYSVAKMKEYGIVDSGDTLKDGIGAMSDARIASFFDKMVRAGVVRRDIDFRKAYTLRFVNKGVGLRSAAEELSVMTEPAAVARSCGCCGQRGQAARRHKDL